MTPATSLNGARKAAKMALASLSPTAAAADWHELATRARLLDALTTRAATPEAITACNLAPAGCKDPAAAVIAYRQFCKDHDAPATPPPTPSAARKAPTPASPPAKAKKPAKTAKKAAFGRASRPAVPKQETYSHPETATAAAISGKKPPSAKMKGGAVTINYDADGKKTETDDHGKPIARKAAKTPAARKAQALADSINAKNQAAAARNNKASAARAATTRLINQKVAEIVQANMAGKKFWRPCLNNPEASCNCPPREKCKTGTNYPTNISSRPKTGETKTSAHCAGDSPALSPQRRRRALATSAAFLSPKKTERQKQNDRL